MHLLEPSPELRHLLDEYRRLGGVIDHLLVQADHAEHHERHRQAALLAIQTLDPTRIEPNLLQGAPITIDDFLGESEPDSVGDDAPGLGYGYAFCDPPYGMAASKAELTALLHAVLDQLVGGLQPALRLNKWSTDWAAYFDAGHEWWGSHLWTLENPAHGGTIAVIAASTTD